MKKTKIWYWVFTGLFAGLMLFSSIPDIFYLPEAVEFVTKLGYPSYFIPFIGVAKLLGVFTILIPGFPKIKEWAYAGLTFDLIGAFYSVAVTNDILHALPILLFIGLGAGSYMFYHKKTKTNITNTPN